MALLIDGPIQPYPSTEELPDDQPGVLTATITKVDWWRNALMLTFSDGTEVFVDTQLSQAALMALGLPVERVNRALYSHLLIESEVEYAITMMPVEDNLDPGIKTKLGACELEGRKVVRLERVNH